MDKEGIVYAEIDLEQINRVKYACESAGHCARPDVLRLSFDNGPQHVVETKQPTEAPAPSPQDPADGAIRIESKLDL